MAGRQGSCRHFFAIQQQFRQTLDYRETEYIFYVNSSFGSVVNRRISNAAATINLKPVANNNKTLIDGERGFCPVRAGFTIYP